MPTYEVTFRIDKGWTGVETGCVDITIETDEPVNQDKLESMAERELIMAIEYYGELEYYREV